MRKLRTISIGILIGAMVLALAYAVLSANSYALALNSIGYKEKYTEIIDCGIDWNGMEYRVVADYPGIDGHVGAAYLTKNAVGFWQVSRKNDVENGGNRVCSWRDTISLRRFSIADKLTNEYESHLLYCGNNAIKNIEIPPEALPTNVAVHIYQAGEVYMLHFVTFGEMDATNQINCTAILEDLGCISTTSPKN